MVVSVRACMHAFVFVVTLRKEDRVSRVRPGSTDITTDRWASNTA